MLSNESKSGKERVRGWFPRSAAIEVMGDVTQFYNYEEQDEDKKEQ